MAGNNCLARFNIFRRNKQPKQQFPNGEKANLVPPDGTVKEFLTKTEPTQAPQTEPQTQHVHGMSTADHEQTMTLSAGDTTREDSASNQSAARLHPEILWDTAYNILRRDEPELVEDYEKVLSWELTLTPTVSSAPTIQENVIEQTDTKTRQSQMRQLVDRGLAKTEHEAKIKQGAGHVVDVALAANKTISTALEKCPEAALAWTGVTFALQVSAAAEPEDNRLDIDMLIDDSQSN